MNTAAKVAQLKREHPELYCPTPRCLWRTGGGYCPRHKQAMPRMASDVLPGETFDNPNAGE